MSNLHAIILAAGKGTRMKSEQPKVLHEIGGHPMLSYVIHAAAPLGAEIYTVVGHGAPLVEAAFAGQTHFALQAEQLGTGHGVMQAIPHIPGEDGTVIVLCGDTPLLREETLRALLAHHKEKAAVCTVLTAEMADPKGYGRIIRGTGGGLKKIVEERDATVEEKAVREINSGVYCFSLTSLRKALSLLKNDNDQGEYYLTDVLAYFVQEGLPVCGWRVEDAGEIAGINDRCQLALAEKALGRRKKEALMRSGVTLIDPDSVWVASDVEVGPDTIIEPQTILRSGTQIGAGCRIGPMADISESYIGDETTIRQSVLIEAKMGKNCNIGPFAYLRPGTILADHVKVGDFVELKKTEVGLGSKVPHHSYVGDTRIGAGVNVGCGTITCNYDGFHKYQTVIEDNVFIGSNTSLVAPVTIGKGAIIAAGSVITADVPEDALGIGRGRQENLSKWAQKFRKMKKKQ